MTQTFEETVDTSYERVVQPVDDLATTDSTFAGELLEQIQQRVAQLPKPAFSAKKKRIQKAEELTDISSNVFYSTNNIVLYKGDALEVIRGMQTDSVDCIVTSPPYYGQRDYEVDGQLGLERQPQHYIDRLVSIFREAKRILKPSGSLWVNIGDTYWSGKGKAHSTDAKQKNRRFDRPQDHTGPKPLCTSKQLLLIPHRFAIAMQDEGWIVRGDNVWLKPTPLPDPVRDRCALTHEYVFHFVKHPKKYLFDLDAVAVPSITGKRTTKTPPSVWTVATQTNHKKSHKAVFPEELVRLPLLATCPDDGVLFDPFCGSGTTLSAAIKLGKGSQLVGIDISDIALQEAKTQLLGLNSFEIT